MRIAFHAPLKAPDHPVPSGDRTMARALVKALEQAGHAVLQPSRLRTFLAAPDTARRSALEAEARAEHDRIADLWRDAPPDLWFTYHSHYKAPDLLGPTLARRFGLPYVLAEASHAPKRASTWGAWHAAAEAASRAADLHVAFTRRDAAGIAPLVKRDGALLHLPPFVDLTGRPVRQSRPADGAVRLITVAMMRPGDKLTSYRFLADALERLATPAWHLDVVGGGPAQPDVQALFQAMPPGRVTWNGERSRAETWTLLAAADLFVWPGFGEAFGLAYLEAQAVGVPAVALDTAGVSSVIRHGETGLLVEDIHAAAYAAHLADLMADPARRARMSAAATRFVTTERSLDAAAAVLDDRLQALVPNRHETVSSRLATQFPPPTS